MAFFVLAQGAAQALCVGLSSDTKPTPVAGVSFLETDTGHLYDNDGATWTLRTRLENRTSDPGSPVDGQMWLRTDL